MYESAQYMKVIYFIESQNFANYHLTIEITSMIFIYQVRVRVRDGLSSSINRKSATAVLTIKINRNLFAPNWPPSAVYKKTILENVNPGTDILQVKAIDNDNSVSIFLHY